MGEPRIRKKIKNSKKITRKMKKKLIFVVCIFFILFFALIGVLIRINVVYGDKYTLEVLNNRDYVNRSIPYKRGDILDRNNIILATSTKTYNLILDAKLILDDSGDYLNPTVEALSKCFGVDRQEMEALLTGNPSNQNIVLMKGLIYQDIEEFIKMKNNKKDYPNIRGVFLLEEYSRNYSYSSLASDVVGFTSDERGAVGLEAYYNSYLTGSNGREYGYVNDDNVYETIIRKAESGDNIVTTIDSNVQSIVEKHIALAKEELLPKNIGVIIADPNTGEILAMASDKGYDLNKPRDLTAYYTEDEIEAMNDEEVVNALNEIWSNFCITYTFEPGSTYKPFTIAAALEEGMVQKEKTYYCDGSEEIGGWKIHCNKRDGHGEIDLKHAITFSCNDALMQIAKEQGKEIFVKYQRGFGFGKSTGIDLPGEVSAEGLLYDVNQMSETDLATNSFGQNFNVTMLQMVSGFSSLINGGNYYEPRMVKKIVNSEGMVKENFEKTLMRKTVSVQTSEFIKDSLLSVVTEGTGKLAAVEGYQVAGKTGTAEKNPKEENRYILSFLGFAPYENPELVCFVVIDDVTQGDNGSSGHASTLFSSIMAEVLPYMDIYPVE